LREGHPRLYVLPFLPQKKNSYIAVAFEFWLIQHM